MLFASGGHDTERGAALSRSGNSRIKFVPGDLLHEEKLVSLDDAESLDEVGKILFVDISFETGEESINSTLISSK